MRRILACVVSWLLFGCAGATLDPSTGAVEAHLGVKGCVRIHRDKAGAVDVLLEHDGMSSAFAGTIRAVVGAASSVFGGEREESGPPEAGEGCGSALPAEERELSAPLRGSFELEPPSPREALR